MKYYSFILSIVFITCIQGCTVVKPMEISAVASPEQQVGYGKTITSQKNHFVSVAPYRGESFYNPKASFILCVKNCSSSPIEISKHDITATFFECAGNGVYRNISIPSTNGLTLSPNQDFQKNEAASDKSISKKMSRYAHLIGNSTYCTWHSDLPEKSLFRTILNQYQLGRQKERANEFYFRPQTLLPGESEDGLFVFDMRGINPEIIGVFRVVVSVNGEEHEFSFTRSTSG